MACRVRRVRRGKGEVFSSFCLNEFRQFFDGYVSIIESTRVSSIEYTTPRKEGRIDQSRTLVKSSKFSPLSEFLLSLSSSSLFVKMLSLLPSTRTLRTQVSTSLSFLDLRSLTNFPFSFPLAQRSVRSPPLSLDSK